MRRNFRRDSSPHLFYKNREPPPPCLTLDPCTSHPLVNAAPSQHHPYGSSEYQHKSLLPSPTTLALKLCHEPLTHKSKLMQYAWETTGDLSSTAHTHTSDHASSLREPRYAGAVHCRPSLTDSTQLTGPYPDPPPPCPRNKGNPP